MLKGNAITMCVSIRPGRVFISPIVFSNSYKGINTRTRGNICPERKRIMNTFLPLSLNLVSTYPVIKATNKDIMVTAVAVMKELIIHVVRLVAVDENTDM
jgi:hypothetical protein